MFSIVLAPYDVTPLSLHCDVVVRVNCLNIKGTGTSARKLFSSSYVILRQGYITYLYCIWGIFGTNVKKRFILWCKLYFESM